MRDARTLSRGRLLCPHTNTTGTNNVGLHREACDACGHVSFHYEYKTSFDETLTLIEQQNIDLAALDELE